jgi:murein L,D-transpeptidase YcbB/YkuD
LAARHKGARIAARDEAGGRRIGVASDAVSGSEPVERRRAAILANMEIWRWEPRDMGERRIEVNIPDFSLSLIDGGEVVRRARIIVGKPATPTPVFSNAIKYIVVNPSWSVPESIVKKEMLPKLASDPDYLAKQGYEVTQVGDHISVRQPPGADNALGRIAFMFPNEHSVYLHDTPSRGLFQSFRRAFSHGCIRVQDPFRLAELAMGGAEAGWPERRFESMIGPSERTIWLKQPLPIHIEYFTEFVDDLGELQQRDDLYGIVARVEDTLHIKSQD